MNLPRLEEKSKKIKKFNKNIMKIKININNNKVKGIDFHPKRLNWVALGLFTGEV
jgi:hypothetical protein